MNQFFYDLLSQTFQFYSICKATVTNANAVCPSLKDLGDFNVPSQLPVNQRFSVPPFFFFLSDPSHLSCHCFIIFGYGFACVSDQSD